MFCPKNSWILLRRDKLKGTRKTVEGLWKSNLEKENLWLVKLNKIKMNLIK